MLSLRCSTSLEHTTEEKLYIAFYPDPGAGHFDHALRHNSEGFCRRCVGRSRYNQLRARYGPDQLGIAREDRKSTRLNSSHLGISYAVFCLKKRKITTHYAHTAV